jgi:TIR domain
MRQDVFVSYSQSDHACAFDLVAQLEARGIKVWVAPRDIAPSADWAAEIIEAIATSRLMVLVFSAACNDSPQVRREVERAVHRHLPILPVRIEDVLPTKSLEYFLSAQHWLDAFPAPIETHYDRLCRQVSGLLRTTAERLASEPAAAAAAATATGTSKAPPSHVFPPAQLESLQKKLAFHVGPLARHLVKQAAATAPTWNELTQRLAGEIEPASARREFIESCLPE